MSRKRRLRPEEQELWERVAQTTTRLHVPRVEPVVAKAETPVAPDPTPVPDPVPLPQFRLGQNARASVPALGMAAEAKTPVRMDAKAFGRMKRGKLVPEDRIDLHGMTLDQAHPTLIRFLMTSHTRGLRLVLVITGKGQQRDPHDHLPLRRGVLRHQVPQWLRLPPVAPLVLQVSEAHGRHGGGGAFYVYLARRR